MPFTIDIPELEPKTSAATENDPGFRENSGGLAELAEFYRHLGFESGYSQAARDQLEFSVAIAEQVLREQGASSHGGSSHGASSHGANDARRLLYAFIARMDRRLGLFANPVSTESNERQSKCDNEGYMEGGLGI
jgi:hypothetical protein